MRRFLAAALAAALLLSVAAPVMAAKPVSAFDICPNLDGWQSKVPHGYVIVIFSNGDWACVPR